MYPAVLLLHSWLRWVVLASAIVVLLRAAIGWLGARPWTRGDTLSGKVFLGALDGQFLLGLILYIFLSPLVWTALTDLGAAMRDGMLRYWAVEHAIGMLAGVAIAHIGHARAKRAPTDARRHRIVAVATALALLVIVLTIPWPSSPQGRPLLRGW